jgi:hypothetical protein
VATAETSGPYGHGVRLPGVGLLKYAVMPLLAVSVSIGAVMPSAPFDAWSPPPVSVERGARPVPRSHTARGERCVVVEAAARQIPGGGPRSRPQPTTLRTADRARAARTGASSTAPCAVPRHRRPVPAPGWALTWWGGTTPGPTRAPPQLRTA